MSEKKTVIKLDFVCYICQKEFTNASNVRSHILAKHGRGIQSMMGKGQRRKVPKNCTFNKVKGSKQWDEKLYPCCACLETDFKTIHDMAAHLENVHQPKDLNAGAPSGPSGPSIPTPSGVPTSSGHSAPSTSSDVPTSSGSSLSRGERFNILNNTLEDIQTQVNTATNTIVSVYDLLATMFEYMTMSKSSNDEDSDEDSDEDNNFKDNDEDNDSEHSDWEGF